LLLFCYYFVRYYLFLFFYFFFLFVSYLFVLLTFQQNDKANIAVATSLPATHHHHLHQFKSSPSFPAISLTNSKFKSCPTVSLKPLSENQAEQAGAHLIFFPFPAVLFFLFLTSSFLSLLSVSLSFLFFSSPHPPLSSLHPRLKLPLLLNLSISKSNQSKSIVLLLLSLQFTNSQIINYTSSQNHHRESTCNSKGKQPHKHNQETRAHQEAAAINPVLPSLEAILGAAAQSRQVPAVSP
jgi:hypothetical protein